MAEGIIPRPEKAAEDADPLGGPGKDVPEERKRVWRDESDDEDVVSPLESSIQPTPI